MIKKCMSLLLCLVLFTGSASTGFISKASVDDVIVRPVMAEDLLMGKPEESIKEPSDKALEAAIKAVKAKIKIPSEYSEFSYSYFGSSIYTGVYWNLMWRKADNSYISVGLDQTNNFKSYNFYDYSQKRNIPTYLKEELKDEAEAFIKKIAPDIYSKIDFVSSNYGGLYSNTYTYYYQRKEQDIVFPDNTVNVSVNAVTGEITSASIEWLRDAKIPSGDVKLTKEEAARLIGEKLNMKLTYKTNYYTIYDKGKSEYVKKAFLVYEPDLSYISIDAKTGEVYLTREQWVKTDFSRDEADKAAMAENTAKTAGPITLTEEEIAKIKELENLISKDEALEIVTTNPYLYIDENLLSYTANLNQSYSTTKSKSPSFIWSITLRDNRPVDYSKEEERYRAYAYATVDAKTGKILSFSASIRNYYDYTSGKWQPIEVKYDRAYGQTVLEKFLKSQVKSLFNKTKLVDQRDDYIVYYKDDKEPVYGGYSYQYNRFNEGIEFIYNGISGSVDGVTGKIYNYYTNWDDDIIFESPKNAMSPQEAFEHYISKEGFKLLYEINVINQYDPNYKTKEKYYDYSEAYRVAYEVRLVYRPDISPSYISPFTGEQLNYNGEVYVTAKPYHYKDIEDTQENRDIMLLKDMNIGFEEEYFYPEKLITEGEMNQLLEKLGFWNASSENVKASTELITREELAYDLIRRLGLENVAKISGIYRTGYADEKDMNQDYIGAIALAKGLGVVTGQEGEPFNPKNNISRREAVSLLLSFVNVYYQYNY